MTSAHRHPAAAGTTRPADLRVGAALVAGTLLVLVAAFSEPTTLWTNPEPTFPDPTRPTSSGSTGVSTTVDSTWTWPSWVTVVLNVVAVAFFVALGLAALSITFGLLRGRTFDGFGFRFTFGRPHIQHRPLPASRVTIDAALARAALLGGRPRNAIVACWMQLENDAAEAGLPRLAAETSAEYAARVIRESVGDAAPVDELAGLYREARFSQHELTDEYRERATNALEAVVTALTEPGQEAE